MRHISKKTLTALGLTAVLLGGTSTPVLAHNHLLNPSGVCNNSNMGVSPGDSGETGTNPGGNQVGQAKALPQAQAPSKCLVR